MYQKHSKTVEKLLCFVSILCTALYKINSVKSTVWILLPGHQRLSPEDGDQKGLVTAWRSQKGRCGDEERGLQTVHESSICREHANCNANPVGWSFASGLGQQLLKRFRGLRCRVEWYAGHELCMLDSCHTHKAAWLHESWNLFDPYPRSQHGPQIGKPDSFLVYGSQQQHQTILLHNKQWNAFEFWVLNWLSECLFANCLQHGGTSGPGLSGQGRGKNLPIYIHAFASADTTCLFSHWFSRLCMIGNCLGAKSLTMNALMQTHALSLWLCPSSSSGRSTVTSRGSSLEAAAFWPFHGGLHRSGQNLQLQMLFNEVNHQISHSWIFNWQPRRYWDFSIVLELTWQIVRTRVLLRPSWSKRRGALLGCAVRSYTWTSWKEKVKEEPSLVSNSLSLPKAARLGLGIAAIASVTALADQDQRVYGRCCSGGTERHGNLIWSYLTPLHWSLPLLFSWHGGRRLLNLVDALTPPLCLCHS